jgi:RNA-directed DNA polymerase
MSGREKQWLYTAMTDKPGTTKLNRIGLCVMDNPNTVFNNLGHFISTDLMREAYQELDEHKATGIDKITKGAYGANLEENISNLIQRIRRKQYQPKVARIVQIPKEDGSTRPLVISCFEDKLVQWAVAKILERIYEPVFLPSSYGFRPNLNCHDALRALNQYTFALKDGAIVEMDIRKCFNMIPHEPLMEMLKHKISDSRFLNLIETLISSPIIQDGKTENSTRGCPQGSIVSPILANIYLHYVIDEWLAAIRVSHMEGRCEQVRYADDMVFVFEKARDAQRFYAVLGKRLNRFGLELNEEKSGIWPSGHQAMKRLDVTRKKKPTFMFLGFTCYWDKSRKGFWRLKYSSRRDRFTGKLKSMGKFLRNNLNVPDTDLFLKRIIRGIKGWINYHAISDNQRRVDSFLHHSKRLIFKWFNRRGRKGAISWENLNLRLGRVGYPKSYKTISMFA